ncbi:MAG: hypothetical protein HC919_14140, partial [Oscillatoriales cyanobacterium SM2_2_1]|nr:hypothetical protein [Oscillatoriales cyanobacterium SM2_2_1]
MNQRVAVVGVGMVSALGNGVTKTWNSLLAGHTGIQRRDG